MALRVVDVVAEGDEAIADQTHAAHPRQKLALLRVAQWIERRLQRGRQRLLFVAGEVAFDVADSPVDAVLALELGLETQTEHLRVPPELPDVCLGTRQFGAIHPRLLPGTDTDHLATDGVTDRVRLRVF